MVLSSLRPCNPNLTHKGPLQSLVDAGTDGIDGAKGDKGDASSLIIELKQNGCAWKSWGSKGQIGAAICPLGHYVAGHEGSGITTGGKRNFGNILCCPAQ
ncbi:MAG: hypothetical protein ACI8WB_003052 [Phenylobacterium sp.]